MARSGYSWQTRDPDVETFLSGATLCVWYTEDEAESIAFGRLSEVEGVTHPVPRPGNVIVRVIYLPKNPT